MFVKSGNPHNEYYKQSGGLYMIDLYGKAVCTCVCDPNHSFKTMSSISALDFPQGGGEVGLTLVNQGVKFFLSYIVASGHHTWPCGRHWLF